MWNILMPGDFTIVRHGDMKLQNAKSSSTFCADPAPDPCIHKVVQSASTDFNLQHRNDQQSRQQRIRQLLHHFHAFDLKLTRILICHHSRTTDSRSATAVNCSIEVGALQLRLRKSARWSDQLDLLVPAYTLPLTVVYEVLSNCCVGVLMNYRSRSMSSSSAKRSRSMVSWMNPSNFKASC